MRGYRELVSGWDEILESLRNKEKPDLENIQHLIFETYHFAKAELKDNAIPRSKLILYKLVGQFCQSMSENYPEGMAESVSDTCEAFALGLCYVIEEGFDGYKENPLPISLNLHIPAGCADLEADMTTYESFIKAFNENVEWLRDEYEEDD